MVWYDMVPHGIVCNCIQKKKMAFGLYFVWYCFLSSIIMLKVSCPSCSNFKLRDWEADIVDWPNFIMYHYCCFFLNGAGSFPGRVWRSDPTLTGKPAHWSMVGTGAKEGAKPTTMANWNRYETTDPMLHGPWVLADTSFAEVNGKAFGSISTPGIVFGCLV